MNLIAKFIVLIQTFVDGKISASQFEASYLELFKNEWRALSESAYEVLNDLFLDVDAYCAAASLRDAGDLDDRELLERAKAALAKLI